MTTAQAVGAILGVVRALRRPSRNSRQRPYRAHAIAEGPRCSAAPVAVSQAAPPQREPLVCQPPVAPPSSSPTAPPQIFFLTCWKYMLAILVNLVYYTFRIPRELPEAVAAAPAGATAEEDVLKRLAADDEEQ